MNQPDMRKNFIYSYVYQILNIIIPIVTAPYLSRILGVEAIGIQSYVSSVQQYFIMFAMLGTLSYGSREVAIKRTDIYACSKLFWEIEIMVISTTAVTLFIWGIICAFSVNYSVYYKILTIGIIAVLFDITWFFNGIEQFRLIVIRNMIFKVIELACIFLFIKSSEDILGYICIVSVISLLSNISLWIFVKKYLIKIPICDLKIRKHFRETVIYFIPTVASSIYTVLDKVFLGVITNDAVQNGYYQQAQKIVDLAKSVVFTSINSVVGVRNAFLFSQGKQDEIHNKIKKSLNFIFVMGFGCCFGIMGIAKTFVPFFFGTGYDGVVDLLYLFSPIIVIIGISNCLGMQYYTPCGKRRESTKYLLFGAGINIILNLMLIPKFEAKGAAVASVVAEIVIAILYIKNSGGYGEPKVIFQLGYKKMIAGMVMFGILYFLNEIQWNGLAVLLLQFFVGVCVYIIMLIILRDRDFFQYFIKGKRR